VDDVKGTLVKFIPEGAIFPPQVSRHKCTYLLAIDYETDEEAFLKHVEEDAESFVPVGKLVHSYTLKGKDKALSDDMSFEVYHVSYSQQLTLLQLADLNPQATWDTPGFRELHRRMQLFILLYIEGGSYINEEEEQWEFVTLCAPIIASK
jgi:histone acetyltransferase 1